LRDEPDGAAPGFQERFTIGILRKINFAPQTIGNRGVILAQKLTLAVLAFR
jgi:hypothetical protein